MANTMLRYIVMLDIIREYMKVNGILLSQPELDVV